MKTETALTPGCAPLSLTRGYSHVTPNGVSVWVPQASLQMVARANSQASPVLHRLGDGGSLC